MDDPRAALGEALAAVADTLRHHRDLGFTDVVVVRPEAPDPSLALAAQEKALQGCTLCKLCQSRRTVVFGSGNPEAKLVVIGEGPGEEEDRQGKPFVGRAGQLLTKMLASVGFDRERDCYICNVVKCHPERNRNPEPDEVAACNPFLMA
ncbi:MAG TPA: uracil-DNA glycosylase, partial [Gaiellaceae bacterium]|nr:uracil-DNA glycosylase [Gaiellaceae bacterium]